MQKPIAMTADLRYDIDTAISSVDHIKAEFERETIACRVADAYDTRGRETGFYQGGQMNFGYSPVRMTVNGKKGSVLVPSEQADALRLLARRIAEMQRMWIVCYH